MCLAHIHRFICAHNGEEAIQIPGGKRFFKGCNESSIFRFKDHNPVHKQDQSMKDHYDQFLVIRKVIPLN